MFMCLHVSSLFKCTSILQKGETIKKLREESGAHINISLGWLERIVAIAGRSDSVFHALKIILNMIEKCPTKGVNIQYRPRPTGSHVVFAGGPLTRFLQDPLNPSKSLVASQFYCHNSLHCRRTGQY
ncbi:poly(rC)-binding protein 2-like [Misgurnus anguillicaudatus]|uniref:poly(rC)-binding protein 2-like n=1 Tax=Misgurnus anguillicaudatus TaxID=75329 RepID=UPI003CCF9594